MGCPGTPVMREGGGMNDPVGTTESALGKFSHDLRQSLNVISLIVMNIRSRITASDGSVDCEYLLAKLEKIDRKLQEIESLTIGLATDWRLTKT